MKYKTFRLLGFALAISLPTSVTYADTSQPLQDGSFEDQSDRAISAPWNTEGSGNKGIDINKNLAAFGKNNAFIRTAPHEWNAITQDLTIDPSQNYGVSVMIRTSGNVRDGFFGVRDERGNIIKEVQFGPFPKYERVRLELKEPGHRNVKVFVGYWAPGEDSWIQIDNVTFGTMHPL